MAPPITNTNKTTTPWKPTRNIKANPSGGTSTDTPMFMEQTAIVGKIPGYNKNIDKSGEFAKQLLKGITYIDLLPMSYAIIPQIKSITIDNLYKNITEIIKQPALFQQDPNAMQNIFGGVLERMQTSFELSPSLLKQV